MRIVVGIKQVPETDHVKINPKTNNLVREGVAGIINPFDKNALEAALAIKDETDAEIIVMSMGPNDTIMALRSALAMGADQGILLSSRAFAGSDTLATAEVLAAAIKKIGNVDMVIFGRQAIDADTGQVGPLVAQKLNLPQATYVNNLRVVGDNKLVAKRLLDHSESEITVTLPAVVTTRSELNKPRYETPRNIVLSFDQEITSWNENDLQLNAAKIGQTGSPTVVNKVFSPEKVSRNAVQLPDDANAAATQLITELSAKSLL